MNGTQQKIKLLSHNISPDVQQRREKVHYGHSFWGNNEVRRGYVDFVPH
jgi:hypothetical protein